MARIAYYTILFIFVASMHACYGTNVITKDIGMVSFYERDWTMTFNLGLKSYIENALILRNTTRKLAEICESLPQQPSCQNFKRAIEINTDMVTRELNRMTKYGRVKRGFWVQAVRTLTSQILVAVGVIAITEAVHSDRIDDLTRTTQDLEAKIARIHKVDTIWKRQSF